MSQRESVEVVLPVADQVKEYPEEIGRRETTVNIHPDGTANAAVFENLRESRDPKYWKISMRGISYTIAELKTQLQIEADEFKEDAVDSQAGKILSRVHLLIRAEKNAPFGLVQKVIETAGSVGMYKVEIAGNKPPPR